MHECGEGLSLGQERVNDLRSSIERLMRARSNELKAGKEPLKISRMT